MVKNSIGGACATVLVALAGGLATPTASHAAIYGGVFDPENANYKWFGNHVFNVSDACLVGDGWKRVNAIGYGGCGSASLTGGDLTVVNKLDPLNLLDDVSKTLLFSSFPSFIPNTSNVWGVNIVGGQLVGVDTDEIGDFNFAAPGTTHLGDWQLRWTSGNGGYCVLYVCAGRPGEGSLGFPLAGPTSAARPDVFLTNSIAGTNAALPQGTTTFSLRRLDVPEPTTVTLVLAALGAGWLTRRRKR
jgi:hypothetical protein